MSAYFSFLSYTTHAACTKSQHPPVDLETYYANAINFSGGALRDKLNAIIKGHKKYSYKCVWDIVKEADEDPNNSNNVIGIYTGRSIPKSRRDRGGSDQDAWNREHIWAKSHGFKKKSQHAYTDAHHLRAADKSVNSDRGNNDFDNGGKPNSECSECLEGEGTWEAPDNVKGDIARMMFYMVIRYEGDDAKTPDLELVVRKTNTGEARFGNLCTLLVWHKSDPVSKEEKNRNDVIYSWQGNRNPFIDHPDFAEKVFSCFDERELDLIEVDGVTGFVEDEGDNKLSVSNLPSYPSLNSRFVDITISPTKMEDELFSALFEQLVSIAKKYPHASDSIHNHARTIDFKLTWENRTVYGRYSKGVDRGAPKLKKMWEKVFQLTQSILNEDIDYY